MLTVYPRMMALLGSVVSDYPRRRRLVQLRGSYNDERMRDHN